MSTVSSVAVTTFDGMLGQTIVRIDGGKVGSERISFVTDGEREFVFFYEHDCCASCNVTDIVGDLDDLIGLPLVLAEEVSNEGAPPPPGDYVDSFTWTFYRFGTAKGTVTISWLGESNGYYNESVTFSDSASS
jgi:hypothetical protein